MKRPFSFELIPLYLATLLVLTGVLLSYWDWQVYSSSAQIRHQSGRVRSDANELFLSLVSAETGQRGFLLTGRDEYLEPYHAAIRSVRGQFRRLRADAVPLIRTDQLDELENRISEKLDELELTITLRQSQGFSAALGVVESDRGRQYMVAIRDLIGKIQSRVDESIRQTDAAVEASVRTLRWFGLSALLAEFALLVVAQITIHRANERRHLLIDELSQRKTELGTARDLLETTLRSIGDGVIATDQEGRITFINPVAQQLTGWGEQSALTVPLHRIFRILNESTREPVPNPVERVLQTGRIVGLANHTILIAQDGREIPIDDSAAPIRNSSGTLVGTVLVFRNITDRRIAERAVEQNRRDLEQSNRSLTQVNADLELFTNAVGHDLQEPLRAVASFSQLAARKLRTDPDTLEYLQFIQTGVARMQAMIHDLLDYSRLTRLSAPGSAAGWEHVPLERLVGEALWNCQAAIGECNASVTTEHLPTVRANPQQMVQLFQNLISNAVKYRSDRPTDIRIFAQTGASDTWVISVQDNGIGFDMKYATEIFQVFRRLHGRESYSGTGIGLAMCKRIVELHGGSIWVDSEPGVGSTFHFSLPKEQDSA